MSDECRDRMVELGDGVIGTLSVFRSLFETLGETKMMSLLDDMEAMNLKGSRVWVAYKYVCKADLSQLVSRITLRDPELSRQVDAEKR